MSEEFLFERRDLALNSLELREDSETQSTPPLTASLLPGVLELPLVSFMLSVVGELDLRVLLRWEG